MPSLCSSCSLWPAKRYSYSNIYLQQTYKTNCSVNKSLEYIDTSPLIVSTQLHSSSLLRSSMSPPAPDTSLPMRNKIFRFALIHYNFLASFPAMQTLKSATKSTNVSGKSLLAMVVHVCFQLALMFDEGTKIHEESFDILCSQSIFESVNDKRDCPVYSETLSCIRYVYEHSEHCNVHIYMFSKMHIDLSIYINLLSVLLLHPMISSLSKSRLQTCPPFYK